MLEKVWKDRGVGILYLKPCPGDKTQLLIRSDTTLGVYINNNNNNTKDSVYSDVYSVHLMNVVWRQLAANSQTKPVDLDRESACRLPFATPTIAIYYYSARRLILILPSHGG